MPGTAVLDSGNYELNVDTGFPQNAFLLDETPEGILAGYATNQTATNLHLDPNCTNISRWDVQIGTRTLDTTNPYIGTTCIRVVSGQATQDTYIYYSDGKIAYANPFTGSTIIVEPLTTYRFSAYVNNIAGTNRTISLAIQQYNGAGTSTVSTTVASQFLNVGSGWTLLDGTFTTNASAYTIQARIYCQTTSRNAANTIDVDAVCLTKSSATRPYFDGSTSVAYPGYTITAQQWNGALETSTSTINWGLTSSYVDSTYVLDGTIFYTDIMNSCTRISIMRGREDVGDQFSAGTMSFTIQDVSGVFNPFDQNSPYYDANQNIPGLAPLRAVNLKRYDSTNTLQTIFSGYIVNYDYNFALGGLDTVTVYCADQFYLLAQTELDALNPVAETSGQRIETVLNLPEVDFPLAQRNINVGTVNLGHDSSYNVAAGTNVLSYISQINQTAELGRLFMSRSGDITFQNRQQTLLGTLIGSFTDDGTGIPFDGVGISFEADAVINRAVVIGLNGTSSTVNDTTSQNTYFIQNETIDNSLLHQASEILDAANYLLNPNPEPKYTSVTTKYLMLTTAQRDVLSTSDIGDSLIISKTFPSGTGTTTLAQELSVEGIQHDITFSEGHKITYFTGGKITLYGLILDDATYGTLDSTNALR